MVKIEVGNIKEMKVDIAICYVDFDVNNIDVIKDKTYASKYVINIKTPEYNDGDWQKYSEILSIYKKVFEIASVKNVKKWLSQW